MFGFTINMVTLMALSLCVGLLIDDAIVVRENIVRHVQMGKAPYPAALDGTQEIGLAVLATTLSIVAVFLPIGFMGGIIGKFFHEFGITIVAAVLISMFVSFTLDPMLSSIWHDPAIDTHGRRRASPSPSTRGPSAASPAGSTARPTGSARPTRRSCAGRSAHKLATVFAAIGIFVASVFMVPLLGTEFVPKADFSETTISFYTPVGSSLEVTEAKARQVEGILREMPEVRYTLAPSTPAMRRARSTRASTCGWSTASARSRSVDQMSARAARAAAHGARHHGHARGPARLGGRQQADRVLAAGPRPAGTGAAHAAGDGSDPRRSPAWSTSTRARSPTSRR